MCIDVMPRSDGPSIGDLFETPFVLRVRCLMRNSSKVKVAWAMCDEQASVKLKSGRITLSFLGLGLRTKLGCDLADGSWEFGSDYKNANPAPEMKA